MFTVYFILKSDVTHNSFSHIADALFSGCLSYGFKRNFPRYTRIGYLWEGHVTYKTKFEAQRIKRRMKNLFYNSSNVLLHPKIMNEEVRK